MGRPGVLGDGDKRSDLECGPRAKKAWGHGTVGWGGCGGDDTVERLPIVSGQQTHLSGGFTSSKLPHMHVCVCTHTHTHTGASHTWVHHTHMRTHPETHEKHRYTHDRHRETHLQHRYTEGHTHSSHLEDTGTLSPSPTQPLSDNPFCPSLSRPGPPAPPGRARPGAGVTEAEPKGPPAAQPQPHPDHTL